MTATIEFPVKLTPRARRILEAAPVEARGVGADDFVGVEHIFLAILNEARSVPVQVLNRLGFTDQIRTALEELLQSEEYRTPSRETGDPDDAWQAISWFGVRCLFRHQNGLYEERIAVWPASSLDVAISAAEEYAADLHCDYLGFAQAYGPLEKSDVDAPRVPSAGMEVFSLMRRSELAPAAYISHFFATGDEVEGEGGER
jgi:hypothetical protein